MRQIRERRENRDNGSILEAIGVVAVGATAVFGLAKVGSAALKKMKSKTADSLGDVPGEDDENFDTFVDEDEVDSNK